MDRATQTQQNLRLYRIVGDRIKRARDGKLTQQQLATMVGLNRSSIAKIEAGNQKFTLDFLFSFAIALEKDPCYFLPDTEESLPEAGSTMAILEKGLAPEGLKKKELNSILKAINSRKK